MLATGAQEPLDYLRDSSVNLKLFPNEVIGVSFNLRTV